METSATLDDVVFWLKVIAYISGIVGGFVVAACLWRFLVHGPFQD